MEFLGVDATEEDAAGVGLEVVEPEAVGGGIYVAGVYKGVGEVGIGWFAVSAHLYFIDGISDTEDPLCSMVSIFFFWINVSYGQAHTRRRRLISQSELEAVQSCTPHLQRIHHIIAKCSAAINV